MKYNIAFEEHSKVGQVSSAQPHLSVASDLSKQTTLRRPVSCAGVALHSGKKVSLALNPAGPNTGVIFVRSDLEGCPEIKASWDNVIDTKMCTTIGNSEGVSVATIEHLMAALSGCHIDNVIVEINDTEVPIMDGSSQPFVFLIECAGVQELDQPREVLQVLKPVKVSSNGKTAELSPHSTFSVGFEIEFEQQAVSRQEISIGLENGAFKKEIARARTFGFMEEVEALRASGLALGGTLDNAVVVDGKKILNDGGLRYSDEFVRHKVLDAVGDLYLAGYPILGKYAGFRAGHHMNNVLLKALFSDRSAWKLVDLVDKSNDFESNEVRQQV